MQVKKKNGEIIEFDSPYQSIEEVMDVLSKMPRKEPPSFANDLVDNHGKHGLSQSQISWAHKLAVDANRPPLEDLDLGLSKVASTLEAMPKDGRRRTSVLLDADGWVVALTLNGDRSKHPGSVSVTNGKPYGDDEGRYYGRISPEGVVSPSRSWTAEIQQAVVTWNATGEVSTPKGVDDDLPF